MILNAVPDIQGTGNWIVGLFTENGFKTIMAVLGAVWPLIFVFGLYRKWWYTGPFVEQQNKMIDAQNVIMEAAAKVRADEQEKRLQKLEEGQEKGFEESKQREEETRRLMLDAIRDNRRGGGGSA